MGCNAMCGMCKHNIWSYECSFFKSPNLIPKKYQTGLEACPHFEQDEKTYIDDTTSEREKKKYNELILQWKKNNAYKNNVKEISIDFKDMNYKNK